MYGLGSGLSQDNKSHYKMRIFICHAWHQAIHQIAAGFIAAAFFDLESERIRADLVELV
jgi:hypothetical protein